MKSILDQFAYAPVPFRVASVQDLFALYLARKLSDASSVRHYADLTSSHADGQIITAYRRTLRSAAGRDLGRLFHGELERANGNAAAANSMNVLAIRVERRAVACAFFHGDHLEYSDVRQLSSNREKALGATDRFINWLLDTFPVESVVIEPTPPGHEIQRQALTEVVKQSLVERLLPIREIPRLELFEAYGLPPLRSRHELRSVITVIWPILSGTHAKLFVQDAAALGLLVQVERQFLLNS